MGNPRPGMRSRPRGLKFLVVLLLCSLIAGCGGSTGSPKLIGGSGGSCAALSNAQQTKAASVVFDGTMLSGQTVRVGSTSVLTSPARIRVYRYLKGHGPTIVKIQTAVTRRGTGITVGEDGVQAAPGEHWQIYAAGRSQPLVTSICSGSHRLRGA